MARPAFVGALDFENEDTHYVFDALDELYGEERTTIEAPLPQPPPEEKKDDYKDADDVGEGPSGEKPVVYGGGDDIPELKTREYFVKGNDERPHKRVREAIDAGKPVYFMPVTVEEDKEFVGRDGIYRLHFFGVTLDGAKAHVIVDDVDVTFDVLVPPPEAKEARPGQHLRGFGEHLRTLLEEAGAAPQRVEDRELFPGKVYADERVPYKHLYFRNLQERRKAILAVRGEGYATAGDDRSSYYRKVAREAGLPLSDWMILQKYTHGAAALPQPPPWLAAKQKGGPAKTREGRFAADPLCEHTFRVDLKDIKPLIDPMAPKAEREKAAAVKNKEILLVKDRTLVMTWDIETHTTLKSAPLPDGRNDTDSLFCLCATFHWKDSAEPLLQVALVDKRAHPDARWTTVVCGTQERLIRAFAILWRKMAPDVVTGFNDSEYDWKFVVEKANKLELLGWMFDQMSALPRRNQTNEGVYDWNYQKGMDGRGQKIKISAEASFFAWYLRVPGCVPIDVRPCFMKIYPKADVGKGSSLNHYLKMCKLSSKADMPHTRMWRIYEGGDLEGMRKVLHYCVIDALRCQQLMVKKSIINDYRAISALSYTSLADAHYYAGGMKVGNMVQAFAAKAGYAFSAIPPEEREAGKYPGALVLNPHKGLNNTRPVTGLDASSLYPSIIITYNLSPEKMAYTEEEAARWRAKGETLHEINFVFNERPIRAWSVRHNNDPAKMGLYVVILMDLFQRRKELKAEMKPIGEELELLALVFGAAAKLREKNDASHHEDEWLAAAKRLLKDEALAEAADAAKKRAALPNPASVKDTVRRKVLAADAADLEKTEKKLRSRAKKLVELSASMKALRALHEALDFKYNDLDSRQKAAKVFMNTFYGEAGNSLSPFFVLALAGGVTTAGKFILTSVLKFVEEKGFKAEYGDTDSLYLKCPEHVYAGCDADFEAGRITREEYWTQMVKITMRVIDDVRAEVEVFLADLTQCEQLKFAYEEVLFPVALLGKKKYFGIPHEGVPNFRPKKLFVRGLDMIKQGQSKLCVALGERILWRAMSVDNYDDLETITLNKLKEAVTNTAQWEFDHFILSYAYKPDKKNVTVLRFIARMAARLAREKAENERRIARGEVPQKLVYELPEPSERFPAVIVKKGGEFDLRGYKSKPKNGDLLEFARVAKEQGLEIDVPFYLSHYVVGQCARLISWADEFQPPASAGMSEKEADKYSMAKAKKFLEGVVKGSEGAENTKAVSAARGRAYKKAYKAALGAVSTAAVAEMGAAAGAFLSGPFAYDQFLAGGEDEEASDEIGPVVERLAAEARQHGTRAIRPEQVDALAVARGVSLARAVPRAGVPPIVDRLLALTGAHAAAQKDHRKTPPIVLARRSALDRAEAAARARLAALVPTVAATALKLEASLEEQVAHERAAQHQKNPAIGDAAAVGEAAPIAIGAAEVSAFAELRREWYRLAGIYAMRAAETAFWVRLEELKAHRFRIVTPPTRVSAAALVKAAGATSTFKAPL